MTQKSDSGPKAAIEVKNLEKVYQGGKKSAPAHALKGIDLTIPKGSMFGLLGPNGAGKSTFINILAGLVKKTSGEARVWGHDIEKASRAASSSLGVVTQEITFDPFFTPREMLELQAGLYGVAKADRITMDLLKLVRLEDKADAYSRTLSGGMKRRLMVAKAMVHSPPILILDEPTAGVDVELRHQLWENVKTLHKQGVTIVLTTHYLEEAEELCDTIAIINHGEVIACEPKEEILKRIDERQVIITLKKSLKTLPKAFAILGADLHDANTICLQISKTGDDMNKVMNAIKAANLDIQDFSTRETDLEDIFIQLTKGKVA